MSHTDIPIQPDKQIESMKKYVTFVKKIRMRRFLSYTGYFRASRYGKYLLSYTPITKVKPDQELLYGAYNFDVALRNLMFRYCKIAEIQFKSHISDSISVKLNDPVFYLDKTYYTASKGERDKKRKSGNIRFFNNKFIRDIVRRERDLRTKVNKYPELSEYRVGGRRHSKKIPCWAAFSYFELGTITNIYSYLRLDLRKAILEYGYSKKRYGKLETKQMDTWLDAVRNLRNISAHHSKLIGKTSSVVLFEKHDAIYMLSDTDFLSRLYALKKVLPKSESENLKVELARLIKRSKFDVCLYGVLPSDWESRFDQISYF